MVIFLSFPFLNWCHSEPITKTFIKYNFHFWYNILCVLTSMSKCFKPSLYARMLGKLKFFMLLYAVMCNLRSLVILQSAPACKSQFMSTMRSRKIRDAQIRNVNKKLELTSKTDSASLRMSSSSRLSATPRKLVFVITVIGLFAKLKVFNSGNV